MPQPPLKSITPVKLRRLALGNAYKVAILVQNGIMLFGNGLNEQVSGYLIQ